MQKVSFEKIKKAHFIGIGGIGISAIAKLFLIEGIKVTGSDREKNKVTDELEKGGAKIYEGHDKKNIPEGADLVVYSIAVPGDNPEILKTKELGIQMLSYPQILGELSKNKKTIAVSGVHGKTTTTAMLSGILEKTDLDPTVIVGSLLKGQKSNLIVGKGEYLIVEACEYKRSFLNLNPDVVIITNIDNDHLDYYRDIEDIQSAFKELVSKVPQDGVLICDTGGEYIKNIIEDAKCKVVDYSKEKLNINLKIPGEHNISNAKAAMAVAKELDINEKKAESALEEFEGTWRRFEFKGKTSSGALVYDDYAHHPTEVMATLHATKDHFSDSRIIVIFQPHLYSRTRKLLSEFSESFQDADEVLILPVYKAREQEDGEFKPETLVEETKKHHSNVEFVKEFDEAKNKISKVAGENDVIITMGAGDVYKLSELLVR